MSNTSLIQAGTAQDTSNGTTAYHEWYEILPGGETVIASVSPGDHIQASINEDSAGTWTIAITDTTSGRGFSQAFSYGGPGTSAEWIEEAPKINGQQTALANFGTVPFTGVADSNSNPGSVVDSAVNMVVSGTVIASPGVLTSGSFTITKH